MKQPLAALDFISAALRTHLHTEPPEALRALIRSDTVPWEAVVYVANNHLLTPALWVALSQQGLADELPADFADYLRELHRMSLERNRHLRAQLLEAVRQLNAAGIVPVLLKGAKHLVSDIYPDAGVRIMSDIDLLVETQAIAPAQETLAGLGYTPVEDEHGDYHDDHHHCPPLFRPGDYATLEIHRRLMEQPYEAILPTAMALAAAAEVNTEGARMRALSPTHRILHNLVHSQLIDRHHVNGTPALRSLHETASESLNSGSEVDWGSVEARLNAFHRTRELRAYAYMARELYGVALPESLTGGMHARLYYHRCRGQMRWRWADRWGLRLGRYSADTLRKTYGCGDNWAALNLARLRRLCERVQ